MSLSDAQRVAELSPSRVALLLWVDCFDDDATLRYSPQFWRVALHYVDDPRRAPDLFTGLLQAVPREQLAPYVGELADRMLNIDTLETTVKTILHRVHDGSLGFTAKSFIGCLCCNQAALMDMLDIYASTAVWRNLLDIFRPFARALGEDVSPQSLRLLNCAPRAPAPATTFHEPSPMAHLEHRDVEATLDCFYRALDLRGRQLAPGVPQEQRSYSQELAIIYESFGHVDAALEAQSHAFASERRRLIVESKRAALPPAAQTETRAMVSWLHHVLAFHGRSAKTPPELNLKLSQIQEYLRQTAATPAEKAEVASIDLNEALDSGADAQFLRSTAQTMLELLPSHWQSSNAVVKTCTVHLLLSIMWHRLGKKHASQSHSKQALAAALSCSVPSLRSHLLSELAFCYGFELGDVVQGVAVLAEATSPQRFDEGVSLTRILLFAALFLKAHNYTAVRNLLEELEDVTLNKFQLRAKHALQLRLMTFRGDSYAAFVYAYECVQQLPDEEQDGYQAISFRLSGARALVQSGDALNAIEASRWIGECLHDAKQLGYSNLVLEAVNLEARLFYNEGDYRSCNILCKSVEQLVRGTPQMWLHSEWQLLNAASTQLLTGEAEALDPIPFQRALYTEFADFSAVPRLTEVCLRPRLVAPALEDVLLESSMSKVLVDMLEGRLRSDEFSTAITDAYKTLVEALNKTRLAEETPRFNTSPIEQRLERLSFVQPPLDDEPTGTSTPPPDIHVDVPQEASSPVRHDEITVAKRLRPVSGSPRKGRKRRSLKLE